MIEIQPVKLKDAEILSRIAFEAKAYWGYPAAWMEEWRGVFTFTSEYFVSNPSWNALINESPVAFYTLLKKEGFAWLENLWVSPEYIGRGVGKNLFLHSLSKAREWGFAQIRLESDPNAAGFYEKMGMTKIGERRADMDGQPRSLPLMKLDL